MENQNIYNCIRNCWRIDECITCKLFKSVKQAQDELREARILFEKVKL